MTDYKQFIETIRTDGTALYPTDTGISVGCNPCSAKAVNKVLELISLTKNHNIEILVDDTRWIEKFVPEFPEVCYDLVDLSDEPLTIIYPNAKDIAPKLLHHDESVAFRVTKDPLTLKYLRALRGPLLSISVAIPPAAVQNMHDVPKNIRENIDYILDDKEWQKSCKVPKIIKIGIDSKVEIMR